MPRVRRNGPGVRQSVTDQDIFVLVTGHCFFGESRWPYFDVDPSIRDAAMADMVKLFADDPSVRDRVYARAATSGRRPWIEDITIDGE